LQRLEIKRATVDAGAIAHRVAEQMREIAGTNDLLIEIVDPFPRVEASPIVLEQVLLNLVSNAAKFRHPDAQAHIRLWSERLGAKVRLWVEDEGIGIAPEHQDRIFGAFERLHSQEEFPGSGMGLAIVKIGVERMGGNVGVCSNAGVGARFWIELPASETAE
jgi:signal transduction histidine kinase